MLAARHFRSRTAFAVAPVVVRVVVADVVVTRTPVRIG